MKTKDVLLLVGGVALGYMASRMNWGKRTGTALGDAGQKALGVGHAIVSDVKDVVVNVDATAKCEQKWTDEIGKVSRFANAEAMQKSKDAYVKSCVASM